MDENKKYNDKAHTFLEAKRLERDLLLAKIVEVKGKAIPFLSVYKEDITYNIVFDPFDDEAKKSGLSFTIVPAKIEKKGALMYNKLANGSITWSYKVLDSPVDDVFMTKLGDWVQSGKYKVDIPGFCKQVATVMRYWPHKDCHAYGVYMQCFFEWIQKFEECPLTLGNLLEGLVDKLKFVFFKDTREKHENEGTLRKALYGEHTSLSIQDCSKKSHELFSKLDFKAEKSINFLQAIMQKHDEALAERQAKFITKASPLPVKRKFEQVDNDDTSKSGEDDNDDGGRKKRKLEEDDH